MTFFNGVSEHFRDIISNAVVELILFAADHTRVADRAEFDTEFSIIIITDIFIVIF
jgi:hypothetical protein